MKPCMFFPFSGSLTSEDAEVTQKAWTHNEVGPKPQHAQLPELPWQGAVVLLLKENVLPHRTSMKKAQRKRQERLGGGCGS